MNNSPYNQANIVNYSDGTSSLEPVIDTDMFTTTAVHTVKEGETLQSIAYQYYGDSGRWGKIMLANNLLDPFTEVKPYMQLIIP